MGEPLGGRKWGAECGTWSPSFAACSSLENRSSHRLFDATQEVTVSSFGVAYRGDWKEARAKKAPIASVLRHNAASLRNAMNGSLIFQSSSCTAQGQLLGFEIEGTAGCLTPDWIAFRLLDTVYPKSFVEHQVGIGDSSASKLGE